MHIGPVHSVEAWEAHLRAVAGPAAVDVPDLGLGALDGPFRAVVDGLAPAPPRSVGGADTGDVLLWRARSDPSLGVAALVDLATDGPLFVQDDYQAIEVWTEAELSGLHALAGLARERSSADMRARVESCRAWHVVNTQPDNATGRPWALHVFALAGTPEGRHYAETLLHNALTAGGGTPSPLAAWILIDCANELRRGPR